MFVSGENFPGKAHRARIDAYTKAEHIVRSRFDEVFGAAGTIKALSGTDYHRKLSQRDLEDLQREVEVIFNLPKIIVTKFASMVTVGLQMVASEKSRSPLDDALLASQWPLLAGRLAFRCTAYGNAAVTARRDETGVVRVSAWEPWCWFPETNAYDASVAVAHTFAWRVDIDDRAYLLQERHTPGLIERTAHELRGSAAGGQELAGQVSWTSIVGDGGPDEFEQTGVDRMLVSVFRNPGVDETLFGDSDITDNDSLTAELTNRLSQISEILDKHADPKLTGPASSMRRDPATGETRFDVTGSRFLPIEQRDDPAFAYLTWESQLDQAMAELDKAAQFLCVAMHMCPDLIGLGQKTAGVEATDTLRIRAYNTLTEVERKRPYFAAGCADMADMILRLAGQADTAVSVQFSDPLPASATERAKEIQALRVAGTISLETAVRRQNPTWTDDEVSAEVERIGKENEPVDVMQPGFV